jgi:hypothetical protein
MRNVVKRILRIFLWFKVFLKTLKLKLKILKRRKSLKHDLKQLDFSGVHCFAAQPEYFRQVYFDLIDCGRAIEYPINLANKESFRDLKKYCLENKVQVLWLFRPEWFREVWKDLNELKQIGITIIAYSTEPLPSLEELSRCCAKYDQLVRLDYLLDSNLIPFDLIIHYDERSLDLLRGIGFDCAIAYPLPVSEKLFKRDYVENKKYDICFIGRSTPYRETLLGPLKSKYKVLHIAHGVFDEDASLFMGQAKIVLNLHNDAYPNFENRVVQAKFGENLLISECLSMNYLEPGKEFFEVSNLKELLEITDNVLENYSYYDKMRYEFKYREKFKFDSLLKFLEENY